MPIRAVEISNFFFIFLFSPPYLDFPPPKPLPSTPQSFFPPFKTFFGTWKKFFFGKFSHLALFGTFWPNLPKYGLLGLKPERLTGVFISRDKIWRFLAGTPFSNFSFGTFCKFLAVSAKNSFFLPFFLSLVKRTIILVFFFSNFQGFTLLPWQKVGRIWLGFDGNPSSSLFVCLLSCLPYLSKFPLFVCLLSFFLPFLLPPVKRTIYL